MEDEVDRLRVPEVESLVPILGLLRHALALLEVVERLYFDELFDGRRRFEALARVACAGLESLLIPRLGPFRALVDFQRKSRPPRLVNLELLTPVELPEAVPDGLPVLLAGLPVFMTVDWRETVIVLRAPSLTVAPASLAAAFVQRPSSSLLLFIAQSSKPSEAEAGRAVAIKSKRNSGTIDALM